MYLHEDKQGIIVEHLKKKIPELQSLYLFGSYADGTAISESDIDIAYLSQVPLSAIQRWNMSQQLAILLSCDVDLVELSQTNTIFRYQILSCGNRIYGSGYDVEYFETLAYSFYLRFQEERQPIVDEIMKNKSVFGNRYA